jgi:hypothetical protein
MLKNIKGCVLRQINAVKGIGISRDETSNLNIHGHLQALMAEDARVCLCFPRKYFR